MKEKNTRNMRPAPREVHELLLLLRRIWSLERLRPLHEALRCAGLLTEPTDTSPDATANMTGAAAIAAEGHAISSMSPQVWGPTYWRGMHAMEDSSPPEFAAELLRNVVRLVPCPICSRHAMTYVFEGSTRCPSSFTTRSHAVKYVRDFHTHVNVRLGKPPRPHVTTHATHATHATHDMAHRAARITPQLLLLARCVLQGPGAP